MKKTSAVKADPSGSQEPVTTRQFWFAIAVLTLLLIALSLLALVVTEAWVLPTWSGMAIASLFLAAVPLLLGRKLLRAQHAMDGKRRNVWLWSILGGALLLIAGLWLMCYPQRLPYAVHWKLASTESPTMDISGTWSVVPVMHGDPVSLDMTLMQSKERLTGRLQIPDNTGNFPRWELAEGEIHGNEIGMYFRPLWPTLAHRGISFRGTIDAQGRMTGQYYWHSNGLGRDLSHYEAKRTAVGDL